MLLFSVLLSEYMLLALVLTGYINSFRVPSRFVYKGLENPKPRTLSFQIFWIFMLFVFPFDDYVIFRVKVSCICARYNKTLFIINDHIEDGENIYTINLLKLLSLPSNIHFGVLPQ